MLVFGLWPVDQRTGGPPTWNKLCKIVMKNSDMGGERTFEVEK